MVQGAEVAVVVADHGNVAGMTWTEKRLKRFNIGLRITWIKSCLVLLMFSVSVSVTIGGRWKKKVFL